jgi:hypothetical protein
MSVGILKSQTWPRSLKRLRHDNLLSVEIDSGPPQTEVRKCIAVSAPLQAQALTVYGTYTGEEIARGLITTHMEVGFEAWLRIKLGELNQWIALVPRARHFGGHQWYFVCPTTSRNASVLWMPPGGHLIMGFAS